MARSGPRAPLARLLPLLAAVLAASGAGCGGAFPGAPATLGVATWNVRWLGAAGRGPDDDALQVARACEVIAGAGLDVWALEEVMAGGAFDALLACLPDHDGLLASSPLVADGPDHYGAMELKVGLVWRRDAAALAGARVVLAESEHDFGGRPPLEVRLEVALNGAREERTFVVVHAKALADPVSWQRRASGAAALKSLLDGSAPGSKIVLLGDLNDTLDGSIAAGFPSPYASFVADAARYAVPTRELSRQGVATTCWMTGAVDHQIATRPLGDDLVPGSVEALRPVDRWDDYCTTVSDHFPVVARYAFPGQRSP